MDHRTRPIKCLLSTAAKSITNILVKNCSEDDAEHSENMTLVMENDDGEKCTTDRLQVSRVYNQETVSIPLICS